MIAHLFCRISPYALSNRASDQRQKRKPFSGAVAHRGGYERQADRRIGHIQSIVDRSLEKFKETR